MIPKNFAQSLMVYGKRINGRLMVIDRFGNMYDLARFVGAEK